MFGPDEVIADFESSDAEQHGIVPRACNLLFDSLARANSGVVVQASYLEVYNDRLNDLLGCGTDLKMLESSDGVAIAGVQEEEVGRLALTTRRPPLG